VPLLNLPRIAGRGRGGGGGGGKRGGGGVAGDGLRSNPGEGRAMRGHHRMTLGVTVVRVNKLRLVLGSTTRDRKVAIWRAPCPAPHPELRADLPREERGEVIRIADASTHSKFRFKFVKEPRPS